MSEYAAHGYLLSLAGDKAAAASPFLKKITLTRFSIIENRIIQRNIYAGHRAF
jgi:hypothetical protein